MRQATRPPASNPDPQPPKRASGGSLRVLLVGGVESGASVRGHLLRAAEVVEARGLQEALALLAAEGLNAALVYVAPADVEGVSGSSFGHLAALVDAARGVPIIAVSGAYTSDLALGAIEAGAADFVALDEMAGERLERAILHAVERRKREVARDKQRETETQYHAVFQASVDGLGIHDTDGYLVEVSPSFAAMHGYNPDELVGIHPTDFVHPGSLPQLREFLQAVGSGRIYQCEAVDVRKDGSTFPVHVIGTPFIYKGKPHTLAVVRDMSERKKAEEAAKRSERRYEDLVNSLNGVVYEWENDAHQGTFTFVSTQAEHLLGYPAEKWSTQKNFWSSQIHPDDRQWVLDYTDAAIRERRPHELEYRMITADGRTVWVRDRVSVVTEEDGTRKVSGIMVDITAEKEIESDRRLKEAQYRGIFEATTDGLVINDWDGNVVEVNPAFHNMHGYTHDEMIGMPPPAFIHPDSHPLLQQFLDMVRAGKQFQSEALDIRKDGSTFPVEVHGTNFIYRGEPHILGIVRDITERKQFESDLRQGEEQYRAIFEATSDGLVINSLEGQVLEVNPAFAAMHGYAVEEMKGMNPFTFIHPDYHARFPEFIEAIREGKQYHETFAKDVRKDGSVFPVEVQGTAFMYRGEPHLLSVVRDITERVHAYEELKTKEEQYHAVFESTTDGLAIADLDANVVDVNPAWARMHGYTREEMLALPVTEYVHPDSLPLLAEYYEKVRAGERFQCEAVDIRKDGSLFHVEVHETPITYNGKPHTLTILRDITERVEADKHLRQKEEQYRAVFEATTDGLAIADLQSGMIVDVNPAWARMHGYTREEMVGMHPSTFVHPDDYEVQAAFMEKARAGERAYAHGRDLRKDGTPFPIEVYGDPFMYNNQPHVLAIMRDTTERQQAEEQLRMKEEQYRAIFEATSDGLLISDLDGNVLEVNPAFAAMMGYTREELVGMDPRVWIHPNSHANLEGYLEKVRAGERYSVEGWQVRKDGTIFPAEVHEAPFIYNGQQHTLAIIRDITERVQARELLEQRVEERTRELATLLEVSSNVASTLELEPLLGRILEQLKRVADYSRASITVDSKVGEDGDLALSAWGTPTEEPLPRHRPIGAAKFGPVGEVIERGEAVIIADLHADDPKARPVRTAMEDSISQASPEEMGSLRSAFEREHSLLIVPLALKDRIIGGLILRHNEPGYYTERHAKLATAIASQAAVAVENARLLAQTHDKAKLEERQRLARELHDSVTQALFSTNLIARSLEIMLQREGTHSPDVMEKMSDLRQLTHGALAEMRALIFELRPGALEEEGLFEAVRKHAAGIQGRNALQVTVSGTPEEELPRLNPVAEEALYRIAQEALHNVVKHARATTAEIVLREDDGFIILQIRDDGAGFSAQEVPAGHMGLGTMGQRARMLQAEYSVDSRPGEGTTVTVRVPLAPWQLAR